MFDGTLDARLSTRSFFGFAFWVVGWMDGVLILFLFFFYSLRRNGEGDGQLV